MLSYFRKKHPHKFILTHIWFSNCVDIILKFTQIFVAQVFQFAVLVHNINIFLQIKPNKCGQMQFAPYPG